MLVQARAIIRNEDIARFLLKAESEYGDVFEMPDGLAEVYLKEGLVVQISPAAAKRMNNPGVETAMLAGAPENAAGRKPRGRGSAAKEIS